MNRNRSNYEYEEFTKNKFKKEEKQEKNFFIFILPLILIISAILLIIVNKAENNWKTDRQICEENGGVYIEDLSVHNQHKCMYGLKNIKEQE